MTAQIRLGFPHRQPRRPHQSQRLLRRSLRRFRPRLCRMSRFLIWRCCRRRRQRLTRGICGRSRANLDLGGTNSGPIPSGRSTDTVGFLPHRPLSSGCRYCSRFWGIPPRSTANRQKSAAALVAIQVLREPTKILFVFFHFQDTLVYIPQISVVYRYRSSPF